ncbi:MAG: LamG-like jellyroll fold domain-containing protein [Opitutaceae bacterium]
MATQFLKILQPYCLLLPLVFAPLQAADIDYAGVTGGEWATDSNWNGGSYPSSSDIAFLDDTVNVSVATPNNIRGIRVGTNGDGRLQIGSRAELNATSSASVTSIIGSSFGNEGYVQQEGGIVDINRLEIGSNSAVGTYHIHSGSLTVIRETGGNSLFLGQSGSGNGTFRISSGTLTTRAGVQLGSTSGGIGQFEVIGSYPSLIGIGSDGSLDGRWTQNTGSTLSIRIDKTAQGITPIFVDDEGNNGGGDVVFENGALLDVDFTSTFLNGGTFTVMEWEGTVTDNGLQFASTVDTNIWSFNVDTANKRLTVSATGDPLDRSFVHPGLAHKKSDLERMREMVAAGIEPYASSFASLSSQSWAQHTYQPSSAADDLASNGGTPNNNALRNDGVAAYYNALMWAITEDSRHAEAAIRIFTAWSGVKNIDGIPLDAGRHWRLIEAAEIIKHTYDDWDSADMQAFKDMLVYPGYSNTNEPSGDRSIYWTAFQGDPKRHGNQGLFAMRCVMAIGVFLDNEIMYDRALRYLQGAPARSDDIPYISGPSIANTQIATYEHFLEFNRTGERSTIPDYGYNEVIHNYIYPNGQGQEFSRDMAHGLAGVGIIATMSEMAWSQGDDLYGYLDNRPLLGLEYFYRYNLSFENTFVDQATAWEPTVENGEFIQRLDQSGRWFSLKANPFLAQYVGAEFLERGKHNLAPVYEMNVAHYRDRIGVDSDDTKWLERGLDLLIADQGFEGQGTPWDHPSWGGLTFRRQSPGDPIQGFTGDTPIFAMNHLPMVIEAENYDHFPLDGEGRTYHDLSPHNSGAVYRTVEAVDLSVASEGSFAVSEIGSGEWLNYTVSSPSAATYELSIRYASTAPGGTIQFSLGGTDLTGNVPIPHGAPASAEGSDWQTLVVATEVPIAQGVHELTVNFGGTSNAFLLNSLIIGSPTPLPIAHWRFDEGAGNIAVDCSGNEHHGTINNPTWTTRSGGGNALTFDGSSTNVTIPSSAFSTLDNEVTLAFWAFGDSASLPTETVAFFGGTSGGGRIINVHLPWNNSRIYWDASDRIDELATEQEFEGSWAHWTFTKDAIAGTMKIYRNGTLWHSGLERNNPISTVFQAYIGSENTTRHYAGMLDDFRLYDVALDDTQIFTLYTSSQNMTGENHHWEGGESLTVSMTNPTGTAGSDWDLLTLECPLILDDSLSPGTPFIIDLDANSLAFDTANDQSWLIATAPSILGTFDSSHFSVDSSTFEANNPINGGTFSVTNVGSEFYLNFTATPQTVTLTYSVGTGGTIFGANPQTIAQGSDGTWVFVAVDDFYSFVDWSDGSTDNPRTDLAVSVDLNVTANLLLNATEVESWRFQNFGSYENTGVSADEYDADFDGISNLIEYATGTDPNTPSVSPFTIQATSGTGFEVRFNRIENPSLNYLVEGTDNPASVSWDPIWSGTGTSAGEVIVPDSAWSSETNYFLRLKVSY